MEHSLKAYLTRQPTEKLDEMLRYCLTGERWKQYDDVILEILQILNEREKDLYSEISPDVQAALIKLVGGKFKGDSNIG